MSRLLQLWLNEDVVLTREVTDFGNDFTNGYLLGELFYRFNQQTDFYEFQDSDRVQSKIDNFCRLEKTIRSLGIKGFDSKCALEVMRGDQTACIRLLFDIKRVLNELGPKVGSHRDQNFMPGNLFAHINMPRRNRRPIFDSVKASMFAESISLHLKGQNEVDMARHLKPFYDEKERQQQYVEKMEAQDRQNLEAYYQEVRQRKLLNKHAELQYLSDWHDKGIAVWVENQRRRKYMVDVKKRYIKRVKQQRLRNSQHEWAKTEEDVRVGLAEMDERVNEVQEFTNILSRQQTELDRGIDDVNAPALKAKDEAVFDDDELIFLSSKPEETELEQKRESAMKRILKTRKDIPTTDKKLVKSFILDIRTRKGTGSITREKRESRRVKFLSGVREEINKQLLQRKVSLLHAGLQQTSKGEQVIQVMLEEPKKYKQVVVENLEFRREQLESIADRCDDAANRREALLREGFEIELKHNINWYHQRYEGLEISNEAARLKRVEEYCHDLCMGIVGFALDTIDHNVAVGGQENSFEECMREAMVARISKSDCLDQVELEDYLDQDNLWHYKSCDDASRTAVGTFLIPARVKALPDPNDYSPTRASLKRYPLQVCITGPPLSGKSTLAWRLASKYNLRVLESKTFLETYLNSMPDGMQRPALVSDELYVEALLFTLEQLQLSSENAGLAQQDYVVAQKDDIFRKLFDHWDADGSGDIDPQELLTATLAAHSEGMSTQDVGKEAKAAFGRLDLDLNGRITWEEFVKYFESVFQDQASEVAEVFLDKTTVQRKPIEGWILDGFPMNKNQARLLELALSGKDVERMEYQPDAAKTLPCIPPKRLNPEIYKKLGAGCVDVFIQLEASRDSTFEAAAEANLIGVSRFQVPSSTMNHASHITEVANWYEEFGVHCPLDLSTVSNEDEMFEAANLNVLDAYNSKSKARQEFLKAQEDESYLHRCQEVVRRWNSLIPRPRATVPEEGLADLEAFDKETITSSIHVVPPFSLKAVVDSGICDVERMREQLPDMEDDTLLQCASGFKDFLLRSPEDTLEITEEYRNSRNGKLYGIAFSWTQYMASIEKGPVLHELQDDLIGTLLNEEDRANFLASRVEGSDESPVLTNASEVFSFLTTFQPSDLGDGEVETPVWERILETIRTTALGHTTAWRKEQDIIAKKNRKAKEGERPESVQSTLGTGTDSQSTELVLDEAKSIVHVIDTHDKKFVKEAKHVFSRLRNLRVEWLDHYAVERADFDTFLRDPTADIPKNKLLTAFQESFDSMEEHMRHDPNTKAELHQRTEDLSQKLWEEIHLRKDEAMMKLEGIKEAPWLKEFVGNNMDAYLTLMQLETARYQSIRGALTVLKNKSQNGNAGFTSADQARFYETLWPIAKAYGESLDPEIIFDPESETKGKKKKGKEAKEEDPSQESELTSDPRINLALQAARSLHDKLKQTDNDLNNCLEANQAISILDQQYLDNMTRLENKANSKYTLFFQLAKTSIKQLVESITERFDTEAIACEAMVLYSSKCIENCTNLINTLAFRGASFIFDNP